MKTMKKIFTFLLFISSYYFVSAQTFSADQAAKKVGDSIKVCDKIYGGRFFETSNGSPTLLNMGAAYPASPLTIMIPGEVRIKMEDGVARYSRLKKTKLVKKLKALNK